MILVVGGGLTGLRAALAIQESGQQVHLVEAAEYAGGRIQSEVISGFTIDKGFQVINPGYSEFAYLDIRTLFHPIPAGAVAKISGHWQFFGDPRREARALIAALPQITHEFTSFFSLLKGILFSKAKHGESAEKFLQRIGVTGEVYDGLVEPFLRGVFLAPLSEVDARFTQRVLRSLYRRIPGLPDGGVGTLIQELANRVKSIQIGERVEKITRNGRGFHVQTSNAKFSVRKVIVATDYLHAQKFSDNLPSINFARSHAWYFTLESHLDHQHQLHVASLGSGPVVSAIDVAAVVPSYSPDGRGLLSVTTLENTSEAEVRGHLHQLYGQEIEGELLSKFTIENALPIISPSAKRVGIIDNDGLIIAGDYLTEPSQNGALLSGRLAGQSAVNN